MVHAGRDIVISVPGTILDVDFYGNLTRWYEK